MNQGVSIIIATWNGKELLANYLPALLSALSSFQNPWEIIVVDDAGNDDTGAFLQSNYPMIRYHKLPENVGNGQTLNRGAEMARHELLFFLDNDVEVTPSFLDFLVPHFEDPDLFAVGCRSMNRGEGAGTPFLVPRVKCRYGIFLYYYETVPANVRGPVPALFASAGHALVSRHKFEKLGGFDDLYGRFYLEDLDLCYQAWKRGWKVFIEPNSHVYHEMAGTIGKILSKGEIERRQWRNRFLFSWKNIHSSRFLLQHFLFLPSEFLILPFLGKATFSLGFLDAIPHMRRAFQKRGSIKEVSVVSDRDVLKRVGPLNFR